MANDRLDIVIFGATGFTGSQAVKVAAQLSKEKQFKFGVAGRRKEALEGVVKEFASDIENVPIIIADLKDEVSLKKMTEQAKVVVNCCGPYRYYGEPVVKACVSTRTHHVDVSGEPEYMETIQLKYDKEAKEAGIFIVSACGFDSIPCDLGVVFTQNKFDGEVNTIETYLKCWTTAKIDSAFLHYATYESAVYGVANYNKLRELRTKLFPERLPALQPKLKKSFFHKSLYGWATLFLGSDRSVALRTQRFLYEKYNQRPIQLQTYVTFKSFFSMLLTIFFGAVFVTLAMFECGRNLLLKYPSFFTGGYVSHEGPSKNVRENTHFSIKFEAKGWTEKLADPTGKHEKPPNKLIITEVSGVDPGYGATSTMLLLSAVMILKESDKFPENGGVLSPGAAFGKTSLIEELNKKDIKFKVISQIDW
ncbi:saccharopine dehydrogenase-like oxidoreductase isoform X2 [Halictus rubicundus]|uniref:saccharopine dehydrogenase-like oxidoreductase isoform X2 n=1 Tax=Halictus rubicundus TaxID=77578 RepID=UPI0040351198